MNFLFFGTGALGGHPQQHFISYSHLPLAAQTYLETYYDWTDLVSVETACEHEDNAFIVNLTDGGILLFDEAGEVIHNSYHRNFWAS